MSHIEKSSAMPEEPPRVRRVFVYIDGFNLYYRRLEPEPGLKWLCIKTLSERLAKQFGKVEQIKFFTAKVDADSTMQTKKQARQMAYWDAIRSTGVEIIEGYMESKKRPCKDPSCGKIIPLRCEKMSDVNLALHVYRDYLELSPDVIFVLSGDCDILPALKMVREMSSKPDAKKIMRVVCLPVDEDDLLFSRLPLHYQVARTVKLGQSDVRLSLLPEKIEVRPGEVVVCPDEWRNKTLLN